MEVRGGARRAEIVDGNCRRSPRAHTNSKKPGRTRGGRRKGGGWGWGMVESRRRPRFFLPERKCTRKLSRSKSPPRDDAHHLKLREFSDARDEGGREGDANGMGIAKYEFESGNTEVDKDAGPYGVWARVESTGFLNGLDHLKITSPSKGCT